MRSQIRKLGLAVLVATVSITASAEPSLTVEGTEFVLALPDGRVLRSAELVGATLAIGAPGSEIAVTIAGVEEDHHATGGRIMLHHFLAKDASGRSADLCAPDAQGRSLGFPVPDGHRGFELTCTSGAAGKCIRWGYRPWEEQTDGPPLRALHQACMHMVRADYGGDGQAHTREGTLVYVCDRFGVRPCRGDAPLAFEAAWGTEGATCVARPRIANIVSLRQLGARYPRLKQLGPAACSEAAALADPATLLLNRSPD
jgi:hypothetical protein